MSGEPKTDDASILAAITRLTAEHGHAPTMREVGQAVGLLSSSSISRRLVLMRHRGLVDFQDRKPRTLRVVGGVG